MDWAEMVMNMYKAWAQHRGFGVTVVDEMPGEIAGIKVYNHALSCNNISTYSVYFREL